MKCANISASASSAVLAAWRRALDSKVLRRLLNHVNQRFRFSYVLGNGRQFRVADFDDADEEEDAESPADLLDKDGSKPIDLRQTNQILSKALTALKGIAKRHGDELRAKLDAVTTSNERFIDPSLSNLVSASFCPFFATCSSQRAFSPRQVNSSVASR